MTFSVAAIVALDVGGLLGLVFVVIALIVVGIQKLAAAAREERQRQEALERRQRRRREGTQPPQVGGLRLGRDREQPRTLAPPRTPVSGQPPGRVVRRSPYRRPAEPVTPRPQRETVAPVPIRVQEELAREQRRLREEERERQRRLAAAAPPEADTAAIEARLVHVRPMEAVAPGGMAAAASLVELGDRDAARKAIIYHEILSPPKGLRRGPELWDP